MMDAATASQGLTWAQILFSVGGSVIGAYAATRYELGRLSAKTERLEKSVDDAHERIDNMMLKGSGK